MKLTKILFTLIALGIFTLSSNAQIVSLEYLQSLEHIDVAEYASQEKSNKVYFPFPFGSSDFIDTLFFKKLSKRREFITTIDFVYTAYRDVQDFKQDVLNINRFKELKKQAPYLFETNVIKWNIYRQKNNANKTKNKDLFHGFVIHYRNNTHIQIGDSVLVDSSKSFVPLSPKEEIAILREIMATYDVGYEIRRHRSYHETGLYYPISKRKKRKGIRYKKERILFWHRDFEKIRGKMRYDTIGGVVRPVYAQLGDSTVKTALQRNSSWKNIVVVEDVTGSMYPYLAQTFTWRRLNAETTNCKNYVFFNDGDSRPDGPIGKSGGQHYINSSDIKKVEEMAYSAMAKGGGGAGPENDIESLIYSIKKYPKTEAVVLIADNNAPVRDLQLLRDLKTPIKIIVCGAYNGYINADYILLAARTGGSLHTMEDDLTDFSEVKEGSTFEIAGQRFKLVGGRLNLVGK